ncbi:SHOCT domain-containing protein [Pseudooceanicola sp. LIPI14-2-Ac024]|uniref:SHOCT domain-containing protein n=1 Tax=Pseudooceanicola sp. LIPI14-2-Ac024 TaxID=3344875 RepID=UPI0035CF110B
MEDSFGFFDLIWSMFWFFLLIAWFWVLISVLADIFRSKDLGGFAKAIWVAFVILIPWLGVLVYLIARGHKMQENTIEAAASLEKQQRDYIRSVTGSSGSTAEELEKLASLKEKGVITDAEFAAQKSKILGA